MFKSIQWRILTLFILLTVSVMTFVGVFSSWGISKYYNRQFAEDMTKNTFTDSMVSQLEQAAASSFDDMTKVLSAFSVRMGITPTARHMSFRGTMRRAFIRFPGRHRKTSASRKTSSPRFQEKREAKRTKRPTIWTLRCPLKRTAA